MSDRRHMTGSEAAAPPQLALGKSEQTLFSRRADFFSSSSILINGGRHVNELNGALALISLVIAQNFLWGATTMETEGRNGQVGVDK